MSEESPFTDIILRSTSKSADHSKKKRKSNKEALWVKQFIKTKKYVSKHTDQIDGTSSEQNVALEKETEAFGEIIFKGATRRAKGKFVQISDESSPDTLFTLMTNVWKEEKPQILISVTGGAKSFNMDPKLKEIFANGLRKVSQTPGAWVLTGGTNTGVMKHVGEALQGIPKTLIGIATWGIVSNRKTLEASEEFPLGGKFQYEVASSLIEKGAFLDHNHTHFMLVDNGTTGKYGVEIPFRSKFEKYIMEKSSSERIPSVLLLLEGGVNSIATVLGACSQDPPIPVVAIKDSGRAADVLSYAYDNWVDEDETSKSDLLAIITETFPELKTDEARLKMLNQIGECMQRKQYITIFKMSGDSDVDEAILSAVLTSGNTPPGLQLQLTLLWDRADLADSFILSKSLDWKEEDLENALIMALALDRVEFVKLLLEYCVSINKILTKRLLEFLYGFESRSSTSTISHYLGDNQIQYFPYQQKKYDDTIKKLCSYTGDDITSCCIPYDNICSMVRQLCGAFIKDGNEKVLEEVTLNDHFNYPYRELFFWAVLNNMHKMAVFLWQLEDEGIAKAIIATEMNNKLAERAEQAGLPEEFKVSFLENAEYFKNLAIKILDECYTTSQSKTEAMITRESTQFHGHTYLSLANSSRQEEFISHSSVQAILNDVWTGVIKTREIPSRDLLLAIVFPPLILRFDFRNKSELKRMVKVDEEEDEDECFDDQNVVANGHDNPRCSSIQLIEDPSKSALRNYESISSVSTPPPESNKEIHWIKKVIEFYTKIPAVKFYCFMLSYFIFLGLFAYVAILKKSDIYPSVAEYILIVFVTSLGMEEINQIIQGESKSFITNFKEYISNIWNIMDVTAVSLFYFALALRLHPHTVEYGHLVYAIDAWVWILRLLNVFYAHRILGPYVVMIGKMFQDMLYFISILFIFMVAYGVSSTAILYPQEASYRMLRDIIFHPYYNIYGELFIERDADPDGSVTRFGSPVINNYAEPIAFVLLGIYLLVANVLVLNLLIAIFGNTFAAVQEKADQIWKYKRYSLVLEYYKRPGLLPPFILLSHLWSIIKYLCSGCCRPSSRNRLLEISLTDDEKDNVIEFEMDCISTIVRKKSQGDRGIEGYTKDIMDRMDEMSIQIHTVNEKVNKISK